MLKIENLQFKYFSINILSDINIEIKKGDLIAICGPSGQGKTTFLNLISGIIKPSAGAVYRHNQNIFAYSFAQLANYRNRFIGYAFQNFNLLDNFTVEQNLALPFIIGKIQKDQAWYNYLLDYFEIRKLLSQTIEEISGGEKERVSLCKAIIHQPDILLIDEPGTYLNITLKQKIYQLIREYAKQHICIASSHDLDFIKLCTFQYDLEINSK